MRKSRLTDNVVFQMHPIWQDSCLWWVFKCVCQGQWFLWYFWNTALNSFCLSLNAWMKPDIPKGWNESIWSIHLWFNGQETAIQIKREPPHKHITRSGSADVFRWCKSVLFLKKVTFYLMLCCTLTNEFVCTCGREYSTRLTAKTRAVRKKHCNAPSTP